MKKAKNRSSRGFAIVEVVVAMAVITVVTITAISIVSMSTQALNKSMISINAVIYSDNVIECYKFAATEEEFRAGLVHMGFDYEQLGSRYDLTNNGYKLTVTYTPESLHVSVFNYEGKELHKNAYRKVQ